MPIHCSIDMPRLTTGEFSELDYTVMAHVFACHKELGRLADECVYQADLAARLISDGFLAEREVAVHVTYQNFSKTYFLDLVVGGRGVYELKSAARLTTVHATQLMHYLMLLNCSRGKLINFRAASVESRFVNVPLTLEERRLFTVRNRRWSGGDILRDWIIELVKDWGTGLELSLYHQAIVHLFGGEALVTHNLEMRRDGAVIGFQRFHLLAPDAAFRITAYSHVGSGFEFQLEKLLRHSPLKTMHWINIGLHEVTFSSIERG